MREVLSVLTTRPLRRGGPGVVRGVNPGLLGNTSPTGHTMTHGSSWGLRRTPHCRRGGPTLLVFTVGFYGVRVRSRPVSRPEQLTST